MRNVKLLLLLLIVVAAFVLGFAVLLPKGPKIIVLHKDDVKETVYASEDNTLSLTMYDTEINKHILRLRSKSDLPFKEQADYYNRNSAQADEDCQPEKGVFTIAKRPHAR